MTEGVLYCRATLLGRLLPTGASLSCPAVHAGLPGVAVHLGLGTAVDCLGSPVLVAALTASSSWSYLGLKATVKAQSTMCPLMCVPKSAAGARVSSWLPALKQEQMEHLLLGSSKWGNGSQQQKAPGQSQQQHRPTTLLAACRAVRQALANYIRGQKCSHCKQDRRVERGNQCIGPHKQ